MLKISGEALAGDAGFGIDPDVVELFASEVAASAKQGVQVRWGRSSEEWGVCGALCGVFAHSLTYIYFPGPRPSRWRWSWAAATSSGARTRRGGASTAPLRTTWGE